MLYYFLLFPHNCVSLSRDNFTGGQQRFHRIYFKLYSSHSITTEIEDKSCIAQNASVKLGQRRQHSTNSLSLFYSFQLNCSFGSWFDIINNWCCIKLHPRKIASLGMSYSKCVRCGEQFWAPSHYLFPILARLSSVLVPGVEVVSSLC